VRQFRADSDIDLSRRVLIAALALMRRRLRSARKVSFSETSPVRAGVRTEVSRNPVLRELRGKGAL
jgi:hypothetical protein